MINLTDVNKTLRTFFLFVIVSIASSIFFIILSLFSEMVLHYRTAQGLPFSLLKHFVFTSFKNIFPFIPVFALLLTLTFSIHWEQNEWIKFLLLFFLSFVLMFFGFFLISKNNPDNSVPEYREILFSDTIHDFPAKRVFIVEKKPELYGIDALIENGENEYALIPQKEFNPNSNQAFNPVFSPVIGISELFSNTVNQLKLFRLELYRLYQQNTVNFFVLISISLVFFVSSGICLKISKIPLISVIILFFVYRLYFMYFDFLLNSKTVSTLHALFNNIPNLPLFGLGIPAAIFFLITLRYLLINSNRSTG